MQYDRVQILVDKFREDKYILKVYEKIYKLNKCKIYRNVKVADIEKRKRGEQKTCAGYNDTSIGESKRGYLNECKGTCQNEQGEKKANGEETRLQDVIEIVNRMLYYYTNETLRQFSENDKELIDIYNKIDKCSNLCEDVDKVLNMHKNKIKDISSDINNIQILTENMSDKLNNRKLTLELLNTYIKIILVTPQLIYDICNSEINDNFVKSVHILSKKLENCKHCLYDSYPSIKCSYIELEKLKTKAIDRIYMFFLHKFHDIRNKKINIHFIQQNLIKFHQLNLFLYNNSFHVYTYLIKEYIAIMNRTYYNLFKNYMNSLDAKKVEFSSEKTVGSGSTYTNYTGLQMDEPSSTNEIATAANDTLTITNVIPSSTNVILSTTNVIPSTINVIPSTTNVIPRITNDIANTTNDSLVSSLNANLSLQSATNKMMNMLGFGTKGNSTQNKKESIFTLNNRINILSDLPYYTDISASFELPISLQGEGEKHTQESLPIIFTTDTSPHFFEDIYKSINKLLIDTGTTEYTFLSTFFKNYENHDFLFLCIYSKTISLNFDFIYYYLNETFDFISLFCIYIINMNNAYIVNMRKIYPLYEFINRIQNLIWNRIQYIIIENIKSLTHKYRIVNHMNNIPVNPNGAKKTIYDFFYIHQNSYINTSNINNSINTAGNYSHSVSSVNCTPSSNVRLIDKGEGEKGEKKEKVEMVENGEIGENIKIGENGEMGENGEIGENREMGKNGEIGENIKMGKKKINVGKTLQRDALQESTSQIIKRNQTDTTFPHFSTEYKKMNNNYSHSQNLIKTQVHPIVKRFSDFYCSLVLLTKLSFHFEKKHREEKICSDIVITGERENVPKNYDCSGEMEKKENANQLNYVKDDKNISNKGEISKSISATTTDSISQDNLKKTKDSMKMVKPYDHSDGNNNHRDNRNLADSKNNDMMTICEKNEFNDQVKLNNDNVRENLKEESEETKVIGGHSNRPYNIMQVGERTNEEEARGSKVEKDETEITSNGKKNTITHAKESDMINTKYKQVNNLIIKLEENLIENLHNYAREFVLARDQFQFLINNYCHLIDVMKRYKIDEEKIERFDKLLKKEINSYIEYQLNEYITDLILFVHKHEEIYDNLSEDDGYDLSNFIQHVDVKLMESIAIQFTKTWKNLLKNIKQEVIRSFTNLDNSLRILKMLNTQILLYFTRFHQLIKNIFVNSQPPPYIQKLPSVDIVLIQIKKDFKNVDS